MSSLRKQAVALDFGCGKLRYTIPLSRAVSLVYGVDSSHQFASNYSYQGSQFSVAEFARSHLRNVRLLCLEEATKLKCDYGLCWNVLSKIPEPRTRALALRHAVSLLKRGGELLVGGTYRNINHFTSKSAKRYGDGWVIHSGVRSSFYRQIKLQQLCEESVEAGLQIKEAYVSSRSAFVIAHRVLLK